MADAIHKLDATGKQIQGYYKPNLSLNLGRHKHLARRFSSVA